jgi:hypothetical protein
VGRSRGERCEPNVDSKPDERVSVVLSSAPSSQEKEACRWLTCSVVSSPRRLVSGTAVSICAGSGTVPTHPRAAGEKGQERMCRVMGVLTSGRLRTYWAEKQKAARGQHSPDVGVWWSLQSQDTDRARDTGGNDQCVQQTRSAEIPHVPVVAREGNASDLSGSTRFHQTGEQKPIPQIRPSARLSPLVVDQREQAPPSEQALLSEQAPSPKLPAPPKPPQSPSDAWLRERGVVRVPNGACTPIDGRSATIPVPKGHEKPSDPCVAPGLHLPGPFQMIPGAGRGPARQQP